jgi:YD repeat-containing protein
MEIMETAIPPRGKPLGVAEKGGRVQKIDRPKAMKTEAPSNHPTAFPSDNCPVHLTYDEAGRVVSRTEYDPFRGEPSSITHCEYDQHDRIVRMTLTCFDLPQPSPAP